MNEDRPARRFEEMLLELQQTVTRLETDEMSLDEAVSAYETTVRLANECAQMLDEAELRISQIDTDSRALREQAAVYRVDSSAAAALLLGDDEEDLLDLLDDEG
jgi:exodeoxyribonuclease VII small subunit